MTLRELDIKWGPIEFSSCTENGEDMKQFSGSLELRCLVSVLKNT